MKRLFLLFLPFLLFVASTFVACEEVEEPSIYDNWQQLNEAFADSIKTLTGDNYVATLEQADNMKVGELYAISTPEGEYIYCRKLVENKEGERPMYSGYHSRVTMNICNSFITGSYAFKTFDGYGALNQEIPLPPLKEPTPFDSPVSFAVTDSRYAIGGTWPIQYMRTGERWIIYVPWQAWGGSSDYSPVNDNRVTIQTIKAYSTITSDLILEGFAD